MQSDELISVVIPVYKVERYLTRCINSVIAQDYTNLEIILVDDGSPDRCPDICDAFAAKDRRVQVIHKTNGGLSSARNAGISMATGTYIMLIDGDDFIDEGMASKLLSLIQKDRTDLAICSFQYVDEYGKETRADLMQYCPLKNGILYRNELLGLINMNVKGYWFYTVPWNKLYKRDILSKLKYPESYNYEDEFMIHHLFGCVDSVSVLDEHLYMYTQRADSITGMNGYDSLKKIDFIYALEDRYQYFKERGYSKYAGDTADLLYAVFVRIVRDAFDRNNTYLRYMRTMIKISMIQLRESKKNGVKLPLVYAKDMMQMNFRRLSG